MRTVKSLTVLTVIATLPWLAGAGKPAINPNAVQDKQAIAEYLFYHGLAVGAPLPAPAECPAQRAQVRPSSLIRV